MQVKNVGKADMDAGVISCFKSHFRNESSEKVRYLMEEPGKDAMEMTKKLGSY